MNVLQLLTRLLNGRRLFLRVAAATLAVVFVAAVVVERPYVSSTTIVLSGGGDASGAGLQALAGQFGLNAGQSGGNWTSPDLVAELISSVVVLEKLAEDSITLSTGKVRLQALVLGAGEDKGSRAFAGELRDRLDITIGRRTGAIEIASRAPDAIASQHIARRVVESADEFLRAVRLQEAIQEVSFLEARFDARMLELKAAEDSLAAFQESNRLIQSPSTRLEAQRLERNVALQTRFVLAIAQALEDARLRSSRSTPMLTVIEPPLLPYGRDNSETLFLLVGGLFLAVLLGFLAVGARLSLRYLESAYPDDASQLRSQLSNMGPSRLRVRRNDDSGST